MKKIFSYILVLALIAALFVPMAAFAENGTAPEEPDAPAETAAPTVTPAPTATPKPTATAKPTETPAPTQKVIKKLSVSISASPSELVSGGSVTLNISVYNPNSFLVENIKISVDGNTVKSIKGLKGNDTYTYSGKYTVAAADLDRKLPVVVAYDGGSTSESFRIAAKDASITVNTISKVDKPSLSAGSEANFSFSIENKSDIAISDVTLKASTLNGGAALVNPFTLAPGDAKIISYSQAINQTTDVSPVLTYTAAGKSYSKNLEPLTVTVSDAQMSVTASAAASSVAANEPISFTVSLKNTGNVDFTSISLYDFTDTRITTSSNQLSAGSSLSATHSMTFTENAAAEFYVIATDAAGTSYTFRSNSIAIEVTGASSDYASLLTLTATPDENSVRLKKPGTVTIALTLTNLHKDAFSNLTITETNSNTVVESYSVFPTGEKTLTYTADIEETTNFDFVLTATDPEGNPFECVVPTVNIPVEGGSSGSNKLTTLLIILGIVFVLFIGGGVVLVVLIIKEKKKKQADEARRTAAVSDRRSNPAARRSASRPAAAEEPPRPRRTAAHPEHETTPHREAHAPRPAEHKTEHKSYEDLLAEPTETPVIVPPTFSEEVPEDVTPATEELPTEPIEELKPLPRRKHRDFEDRNQF